MLLMFCRMTSQKPNSADDDDDDDDDARCGTVDEKNEVQPQPDELFPSSFAQITKEDPSQYLLLRDPNNTLEKACKEYFNS